MIQLLKLIGQLMLGAFHDSKQIRQMAGFASVCLALSVVFSLLTAWLSYPAYEAMTPNPDPRIIWAVADFVALLMFYATSTIGRAIAETSKQVDLLIGSRELGFVVLVAAAVGGFDAWKGYQVGAGARAAEVHHVTTYEEATPGPLPYQTEIDQLTAEIAQLYSKEEKVLYNGKMVTPWKHQKAAEKLTTRRDEYQDKQLDAVEAARQVHGRRMVQTQAMQNDATVTLKGLSLLIYALQVLLAVPLGLFAVEWDLMDGVRDGQNDRSRRPAQPRVKSTGGSWWSRLWKKNASPAPAPEPVLTPVGFRQNHGKNPPEDDGSDSGSGSGSGSGFNRDIELGNGHPPFTGKLQPGHFRGIDKQTYKRVVKYAPKVLEEYGRYHREEIALRAGTSAKTVLKHLKVAWEIGDLEKP